MGLYARPVGPYLDGGSPYLSSSPGGPVLSAAWRRDDACSETAVPSVLADCAGVSILVRTGVLDGARSLPIPPRGRDGGEVVWRHVACGEMVWS